jgi:hypothetical protein
MDDQGNVIGVKREQAIDAALLKNLEDSRSKRSWHGEETLRIASVPVALIESLQNKGIDMMQMDAKEVLATLKTLGYDDFIAYGGNL